MLVSLTLALTSAPADEREPQTIIDDVCLRAQGSIDRELEQEGFSLRADNWTGLLESDRPQIVNSQLFKGHEYLFSLAADRVQGRGRPLVMQVADRSGRVLASASSTEGAPVVLKFKPASTGSFLLVLRLDPEGADQSSIAALSALMIAYR